MSADARAAVGTIGKGQLDRRSVRVLRYAVGSTIAQEPAGEIGRYQASAVLKQDGANRLFITVIDTSTGQIFQRWRADPNDYKRPEGDWIFIQAK